MGFIDTTVRQDQDIDSITEELICLYEETVKGFFQGCVLIVKDWKNGYLQVLEPSYS